MAGFSRGPRRRERCVQRTALLVRKVVTFVVGDEIDDRPIGERGRLVQDEATLFDAGSERGHLPTVRRSARAGKRSAKSEQSFKV